MRAFKGEPAIGVLAALIAFAIDQITKAIVVSNASVLNAGVSVVPGFDLTFHRNDGVTGLLPVSWTAT